MNLREIGNSAVPDSPDPGIGVAAGAFSKPGFLARCRLLSLVLSLGIQAQAGAQTGERWFQIEVSIFSNEAQAGREAEHWPAEMLELQYPGGLRRLDQLIDILLTDDLNPGQPAPDEPAVPNRARDVPAAPEFGLEPESEPDSQRLQREAREAAIGATGPHPAAAEEFRFFDLARDDFLQLPLADSDFRQTNRTLEQSAGHRLLFHGLWRQAVTAAAEAVPIYVQGGLQYGDQHELQGSLTIRFNQNQDRVVVDTDLWLTEFSIVPDPDNEWRLPPIPESVQTGRSSLQPPSASGLVYHAIKVYHMQQSRDMRSTEFHYLDHPALGLVILVEPYQVPALPRFTANPDFEF